MSISEPRDYPHRDLTERVIGAAIEVHKVAGPGLLESAYQAFLAEELRHQAIPFSREVMLPARYRSIVVDCGYRMDFVIDEKVIVELKSVERIEKIHESQLLTYLRMSNLRIGLLINFNVPLLRDGIIRRII